MNHEIGPPMAIVSVGRTGGVGRGGRGVNNCTGANNYVTRPAGRALLPADLLDRYVAVADIPPDAFPLRGTNSFLRETFSQLTISNGRVSRGARTRSSFHAFLSPSLFLSHLPLSSTRRNEVSS